VKVRTEYLLNREIDLVLAALTPPNRLVIRTALITGLRIGDVLQLKPEKLKPHFWVTEQKTGKARQVGLPEPLLSDLKLYAGQYWVFPGRDPRQHRTRQAVWKDVKRAARAFRMNQNVAPHSFRKVYAVELMKKYGDIERVQRALNHSNPTITMIYALADAQLQKKYSRRRTGYGRRKS
jgi:integrase